MLNLRNYVVIHINTTGYFNYDEITAIAILKVKNNIIIDELQYNIKSSNKPGDNIQDVMPIVINAIELSPIVCHTSSYVIRFIKKYCLISNDVIDIRTICRNLNPYLQNYKLFHLAELLDIKAAEHSMLATCHLINDIYKKVQDIRDTNEIAHRLKRNKYSFMNLFNDFENGTHLSISLAAFIPEMIVHPKGELKSPKELNKMDRLALAKQFSNYVNVSFDESHLLCIAKVIDYFIPRTYANINSRIHGEYQELIDVDAKEFDLVYYYKSNID